MRDHLRRVALTVDEIEPGRFEWRLIESAGSDIVFENELDAAHHGFPSYSQAARAGFDALLALAGRSPAGPRARTEEKRADPVLETRGSAHSL